MEKAPEKTQSKHFNWSSIAKHEEPESVLTIFFQLLDSRRPGAGNPIRKTSLGRAVENLRVDYAGGMLISPKKLEHVLMKLKNG